MSKEEADDMRDELTDRFGAIPASVENLLLVAYLRTIARGVFVTEIVEKENGIEFRVMQNAGYDPMAIAPFVAGYKGKVRLIPGKKPCFLYRFSPGEISGTVTNRKTLDISLKMCEDMKTLVERGV